MVPTKPKTPTKKTSAKKATPSKGKNSGKLSATKGVGKLNLGDDEEVKVSGKALTVSKKILDPNPLSSYEAWVSHLGDW